VNEVAELHVLINPEQINKVMIMTGHQHKHSQIQIDLQNLPLLLSLEPLGQNIDSIESWTNPFDGSPLLR